MFLSIAVAGSIFFEVDSNQTASESANSVLLLFTVSFVNSIIFWIFISQSKWRGLKLVSATFVVYWVSGTLLSQLDSIIYKSTIHLQQSDIINAFLSGTLSAVLFSVLAVLISGKRKGTEDELKSNRINLSPVEWLGSLSIFAALYVLLYFVAGYYIAWQNSDVRVFYSGSEEIAPFIEHMFKTFGDNPGILIFQVFRGLIWICLALLITISMKCAWWIKALTVASVFGIVQTSQLLIPNPFMPEIVRHMHFIEISISSFLFGGLVGSYYSRRSDWTLSEY